MALPERKPHPFALTNENAMRLFNNAAHSRLRVFGQQRLTKILAGVGATSFCLSQIE